MPIDLKPSEAMAAEAERGLRWRAEYNRGGTAIGVARARDISNRKNLSPSTVRRMVSYFARHEVDKQGQGFSPGEDGYPSAGRIAWALWGGDSGKSWADEKSRRLEAEPANQSFKMQILQIENKAGKVKLSEGVHSESVERLIEEMSLVFGATAANNGANFGELMNCYENAADTLEIEIHSPGGSVLDGYKLYHALLELRERGVYVTATINSLAASMASVVAMAADKIRMVKGGRMMIHEVSTVTAGNAEQHAKAADLLDSMSQEIAEIYAGRTGKEVAEMREMMKGETWMNAIVAIEHGFIDEVIQSGLKQAKNSACHSGTETHSAGMGLFTTKAEWENKVEGLNARIGELESDVTASSEALIVAQNELATATETITAHVVEIAALSARQTELETELAAANETIEAANKAKDLAAASAGVKASEMLASAGHPPVEVTTDDSASPANSSKTPHLDKFNSLTGFEKSAYYQANSTAIRKESNF